jgi:hypothetical protein
MDRLKLTKLVRPSGGKNSSPYRGQLPVEMGIKKNNSYWFFAFKFTQRIARKKTL